MDPNLNNKSYDVVVIGIGEIGGGMLHEIAKRDGKDRIFGVDINEKILKEYKSEGFNVGKKIPIANHYIIAVYSTHQVLNVVHEIPLDLKPLISVEATDEPGTIKKIHNILDRRGESDLFCFPHRYNPEDENHQFFNIHRVAGSFSEQSTKRGVEFYKRYMNESFIHIYPIDVVELCKPMENTFRFIEIAFAEELKMRCNEKNIDFETLREAMNTKWNIDIMEARDGIGGKCLPKDSSIINHYFGNFNIINASIESDAEYKGLKRKFPKLVKNVIIVPIVLFTIIVVYLLSNRIFVFYYLNEYVKSFDQFAAGIHQIEEMPKDQRLDPIMGSIYEYFDEMDAIKSDIQVRKSFPGSLFRE